MNLWYCAQRKSSDTGADIENPAKPDRFNDTAIREALDPEGERKASPSTDSVARAFPEEDGDGAPCKACYCSGQYEHASHGLRRGVDRRQYTELEDEDEAYERKSVESNQEERSPSVFMTPERRRKSGKYKDDTQNAEGRVHFRCQYNGLWRWLCGLLGLCAMGGGRRRGGNGRGDIKYGGDDGGHLGRPASDGGGHCNGHVGRRQREGEGDAIRGRRRRR